MGKAWNTLALRNLHSGLDNLVLLGKSGFAETSGFQGRTGAFAQDKAPGSCGAVFLGLLQTF